MNPPSKALTGFEIARDIASWLPDKDRDRAERIIRHHEREHEKCERQQAIQGAD